LKEYENITLEEYYPNNMFKFDNEFMIQ